MNDRGASSCGSRVGELIGGEGDGDEGGEEELDDVGEEAGGVAVGVEVDLDHAQGADVDVAGDEGIGDAADAGDGEEDGGPGEGAVVGWAFAEGGGEVGGDGEGDGGEDAE